MNVDRVAVPDLIQAIRQLARYAASEPGTLFTKQAALADSNLDLIEQAITTAIYVRQHGHWQPSTHEGWWTVNIDVPNGIQNAAWELIERTRP